MEDSKNVCTVNAKDLKITWSGDRRYWRWVKEADTSGVAHDVAELLNVSWLEVSGKLEAKGLSPRAQYEVVFAVKMKTGAYGWDAPVNFKFTLPDGTSPSNPINLEDEFKNSKDKWKYVQFGEFTAPGDHLTIEFSMHKYGGKWKSGLFIQGVSVRPKS